MSIYLVLICKCSKKPLTIAYTEHYINTRTDLGRYILNTEVVNVLNKESIIETLYRDTDSVP